MYSVVSKLTFRRNMSPPSSRSKNNLCLLTASKLVYFFTYSSTLNMKATCPSETCVEIHQITRRPVERTLVEGWTILAQYAVRGVASTPDRGMRYRTG
jgi:hypothetical protein